MKWFISILFPVFVGCGASPACPEPVYGGKASDEALLSLRDAEKRTITDDAKAAVFITPTAGQVFPPATPPTFLWNSPLTASLAPPSLFPERSRRAHGSQLTRPGRFSLYDLLVPSAHAHLPPVSGAIHLLRIAQPGKTCPFELVTTRTEWAIEATHWEKLKESAGQTLSMTVVSAYLMENRITEGPFVASKPLTFSISK